MSAEIFSSVVTVRRQIASLRSRKGSHLSSCAEITAQELKWLPFLDLKEAICRLTVTTLEKISADIQSAELKTGLELALKAPYEALRLKEAATIRYTLSPAQFQSLFPPSFPSANLLNSPVITLKVAPMTLPF